MKDFDYFAEGERELQERFKAQRDRLAGPLVGLLARCGVRPLHVSLLGMLLLVPFAWLVVTHPDEPHVVAWACLLIVGHLLTDALDGPLARRLGTSGNAGSLVDMCCDHGGLVVVAFTLAFAGLVDGILTGLYVFTYTAMVVAIIALNVLERPFPFVFRSKYLVYLVVFGYGVTAVNVLWHALVGFTAVNSLFLAFGLWRAHAILAERDRTATGTPVDVETRAEARDGTTDDPKGTHTDE